MLIVGGHSGGGEAIRVFFSVVRLAGEVCELYLKTSSRLRFVMCLGLSWQRGSVYTDIFTGQLFGRYLIRHFVITY